MAPAPSLVQFVSAPPPALTFALDPSVVQILAPASAPALVVCGGVEGRSDQHLCKVCKVCVRAEL